MVKWLTAVSDTVLLFLIVEYQIDPESNNYCSTILKLSQNYMLQLNRYDNFINFKIIYFLDLVILWGNFNWLLLIETSFELLAIAWNWLKWVIVSDFDKKYSIRKFRSDRSSLRFVLWDVSYGVLFQILDFSTEKMLSLGCS